MELNNKIAAKEIKTYKNSKIIIPEFLNLIKEQDDERKTKGSAK
jgi:ribosomal protein S19